MFLRLDQPVLSWRDSWGVDWTQQQNLCIFNSQNTYHHLYLVLLYLGQYIRTHTIICTWYFYIQVSTYTLICTWYFYIQVSRLVHIPSSVLGTFISRLVHIPSSVPCTFISMLVGSTYYVYPHLYLVLLYLGQYIYRTCTSNQIKSNQIKSNQIKCGNYNKNLTRNTKPVSVISSDPLCKDGNARFTKRPIKSLSDEV